MSDYIVTFFKSVLSSDGHETKAPQMVLNVQATHRAEAEKQSQLRFAQLRGIWDWRLHADSCEVLETKVEDATSQIEAIEPSLPH